MTLSPTTWWTATILIALGTYLLRISFLQLFAGRNLPPWLRRGLAYIPCSVLPALVAPAVFLQGEGPLGLDLQNPRVLAALLAAVVAYRTRNVLATILTGMGALGLLRFALS